MKKSNFETSPNVSPRRKRRIFLWIGLSLIILLVIAYLAIGAIAASQLTLPKRVFNPDLNPSMYDLAYEEIRYPARNDGTQIAAWYIPSGENEKVIILVHGRDNSRTNGFCDGFVAFANDLHKAGFSVMMIDLRGHGESSDSRFYFGIKEYQDILGAVDWLEAHEYQPGKIGVLGYSLGAASVVYAAAEGEDIGAIWIDSAYADVKSVIEGSWVSESGLPQVFLYSAEGMIRLLYGYNVTTSRPIDQIGEIKPRPIFIAHCKEDNMIPISHMDELQSAAQNTQTWVITNCDQHTQGLDLVPENLNNHAIGYSLQPEVYTQKVIQFFSESLE
jgi:dipeptidyl aminopeptidase/acylaminoacyl peptidase